MYGTSHTTYKSKIAAGVLSAVGMLSAAGAAAIAIPTATASTAGAATTLVAPTVPASGAYLGIDPNFATGDAATQATQFEATIGHSVSIISMYTQWTTPVPTADMSHVATMGAIPMVSMNCGDLDSNVASGKDDAMITADAQAYKAYGGPVLFRWFWEMNLKNVTKYNACLGTVNQSTYYVQAYRRIVDIFHQVGASNVSFVWAPSGAIHAPSAVSFYPGAYYVNWIGCDIYDRTGTVPFATAYAPFYNTYSSYGKPLMVTETGSVGSWQSPWLTNLATTLPTQFPEVHAVVYVDAIDLYNYELASGTTGLSEYETMATSQYFAQAGLHAGFVFATASGSAYNYGANNYGSAGHTASSIVGIAEAPGGSGYWLAAADGAVYAYGSARSYGSMYGQHLNAPITAIAAMPDGKGYWLLGTDGGIFSFGDAKFHGSTGGMKLNKPVFSMAPMPDGKGYWLVASDGGMFTFGDAKFHGSTGGIHLNKPIVGMTPSKDGKGYWLVASDGGIFTFGDAHYMGSLGGTKLATSVSGISLDPISGDYRIITRDGAVYQFPGMTQFHAALALSAPAVGIVSAA